MAVGEDKIRILITVPKEMKKELDELAKNDLRSTSNFIVSILRNYIDDSNKNKSE